MKESSKHDAGEREPSPYLRRSKQVEVRRSAVRWRRFLMAGTMLALLSSAVVAAAAFTVSAYLATSPRFTLKEGLWIGNTRHASREEITHVFAPDMGRSVFDIPLEKRREELMTLPWVRAAHVARGWPNRIRVAIEEREPVAFARLPASAEPRSGHLRLIDAQGVLMPLSRKGQFTFPVLTGVSEAQSREERQRRVAVMLAVLADLDRETPRRSGEVSEIDLSNPADAAITVTASGSAVLVHLGNAHFLDRYRLFLENVESWREQYGSVRSVDLRFEKQVVVKP
jgi:cell division protein FtsQ